MAPRILPEPRHRDHADDEKTGEIMFMMSGGDGHGTRHDADDTNEDPHSLRHRWRVVAQQMRGRVRPIIAVGSVPRFSRYRIPKDA